MPDDIEEPVISKLDIGASAIMNIAVSGMSIFLISWRSALNMIPILNTLMAPVVEQTLPPIPIASVTPNMARGPQSWTNCRAYIVAYPVPVCPDISWKNIFLK